MKGFLIDSLSMMIVAVLLYLYLGNGLAAMLVFVVGLIGIRQARKYATKQIDEQDKNPNFIGAASSIFCGVLVPFWILKSIFFE